MKLPQKPGAVHFFVSEQTNKFGDSDNYFPTTFVVGVDLMSHRKPGQKSNRLIMGMDVMVHLAF